MPEPQASFNAFATTSSSSVGINHLSRGGVPSLLAEAQQDAQKQEKSHEQRINAALNFTSLPILQRGAQLAAQTRGFSPSLAHTIFRSAQAAQNPNLVSPAYSALDQQQLYRKSEAASLILSNAANLRSSVASNLSQDKGSLSPISLTSSENRSNLAPQNSDPTTRNPSTSNNSAALRSTY